MGSRGKCRHMAVTFDLPECKELKKLKETQEKQEK